MALALSISPEAVSLSKNQVHVRLLSTSHSGLDNYRAVLRILFEDVYASGTFTQVAEIEAIPDSNGFSNFYIQKILDAELHENTPFRVPDLEDPHPYTTDTKRRYKIQYLEKYGDPQVEQAATTSSALSVLLGGVDIHYAGLYNFFDNVDADNSLLTYMPTGKVIARDQKDVITFLNHTGSTKYFGIAVRQYDVTGTEIGSVNYLHTGIADGPEDAVGLVAWACAVFPVGPEKLSISSNAVKYTVQVYEMNIFTATPVAAQSQVFTYYVSEIYQEQPFDLIWFGSFHNPHILRCTGRKRTRLTIERLISERVTEWGYDPHVGQQYQHDRNFNQQFTYRTGSLRPDDVDALQELLIENKLLEHATDGNYYRLRLTENTYDILETRTSPNYLDFNAVRSLAPGNYMKVRSAAVPPAGENVWEQNDNGYWDLNTGNGYWELN